MRVKTLFRHFKEDDGLQKSARLMSSWGTGAWGDDSSSEGGRWGFPFFPPIFPETKHLPPSLKDDMLSRAIATEGKSIDCIKLMNSINFQHLGRPSVREPLVEMQLNSLLMSHMWLLTVFVVQRRKKKKMVMVVIMTHLCISLLMQEWCSEHSMCAWKQFNTQNRKREKKTQ